MVGASRGFGLALATSYASSGAIVHATVRNTTRASMDSLAHQIGGNVQLHALDVRSKDQLAALADDPTIRKLDLLIHSAGINQGSFDVQRRVNAEAPFEVINAMLPRLQASRQPRVCLVTSNMGTDAQVKHQRRKGLTSSIYVYALTKLMANRRFRQLEPEWRAAGITAVALHPGWMATDMTGGSGLITANASAERVRTLLEALPFDAVGAWFDWSGARLDWRTGKPTTTSGVSVQPTSSSSVTGPPQVSRWIRDDQSGRSARSWGPLVGGSVAELLKQHHDPLHALSEGKVSAVVLKNQLKSEELERLTKRLEGPELSQLWSIGGGPKGGFGTIGVQLAKALPHRMSPSRFASASRWPPATPQVERSYMPPCGTRLGHLWIRSRIKLGATCNFTHWTFAPRTSLPRLPMTPLSESLIFSSIARASTKVASMCSGASTPRRHLK